ncbi:hypothetical protein ACHQM5_008248 [Ranunculus cassubicifolius]
MWLEDDSVREVIQQGLQTQVHGSPSYQLCKKLAHCRMDLIEWNKKRFGNFNSKIAVIEKEIEALQQQMEQSGYLEKDIIHEQELVQESDYWLGIKDTHWAQKARLDWRHLGETNTRFFHIMVTKRRQANQIIRLKKADGSITEAKDEISNELENFFSNLFQSQDHVLNPPLLDLINPSISPEQNINLQKPVTDKEVWQSLKSIGDWKAPGHDGTFTHEMNFTHLVLLPKCDFHLRPEDHRPINLMNVVYKIISKIMVERMKPLVRLIIGPMQAAFLKGRSIQDNILLAKEIAHVIQRKANKGQYFGLKLDMQCDTPG